MIRDKWRSLPLINELWQRLEALPPLKTEESIIFRILVQTLVIVGIIATDVAAQTQMSLWAVPLSIVGAVWSWHHRQKQNIALKFILAIAMLLVLFAFFGNLFQNLNDTRLVLAQLLIELQVLHSFDLPRRKDLGYSMVIGLILLGVAGTVSQTLAFAPFLLIFLAIALPALVLDYRSRLGLEIIDKSLSFRQRKKRHLSKKYSPLSPSRLSIFLLITLVLGLTIFAIMPRFPGYRLQTFPVSSPVDLENKGFDEENRGIANPGYVNEGADNNGGSIVNKGKSEGPGEVDDTFYYGFNSKMNQNLRGEMTRKMVLRIRSQAPGFWRVLGFDYYNGQGWEISREDKQIDIKRYHWSYRFHLPFSGSEADTKTVIQTYTAVTDLPNIIPNLSIPKYIFFPTKELAIDPEGSLRSPAGLTEGLTYTVISKVPYRNRTLLGNATEEYSSSIKKNYLQIPPEIEDKVKQKAEELLGKSPKPITSAYEKALFLTQALKQNYTINPLLPYFSEDEDLVESFLFKHQGGYPDHFSTVLTIMLRSLGIPARLAVGFAPGQFNPFTGYYLVHNTDAYALTEVYFPGYGWYYFDPIPGHEIVPPSFEEDQTFSILKQFWRWIAGWLPSPVSSFISNLWMGIIGLLIKVVSWFWRMFSSSIIGAIIGLVILISVGFFLWLGWKGLINWFYRRRLAKLAPIEQLYLEMLTWLQEQGYPKHPAQTPLEYSEQLRQNYQFATAEAIADISHAYIKWRYGEQIPNITELKGQFRLIKAERAKLYPKN